MSHSATWRGSCGLREPSRSPGSCCKKSPRKQHACLEDAVGNAPFQKSSKGSKLKHRAFPTTAHSQINTWVNCQRPVGGRALVVFLKKNWSSPLSGGHAPRDLAMRECARQIRTRSPPSWLVCLFMVVKYAQHRISRLNRLSINGIMQRLSFGDWLLSA